MSLQYIIDGYNLIKHPLLAAEAKSSGSDRRSLLNFIKRNRLTGSPKNKVTVVFDGYPDSREMDTDSDINIIFSRKISADEKIRKLVEEASNRKSILVVTNDREIQFFVKAAGATVAGIEEFIGINKKESRKAKDDTSQLKLTFSEMQKVNDELRKIWLK